MLGNLVAALALAGPVTGVPSALLAPTEPAPTDVAVAWATPAHSEVVVTWNETGDVRNRVIVVLADGTLPGTETGTIVEPGQPNRIPLPSFNRIDSTGMRVAVTVVDAEGNDVSERGLSPVFDTSPPPEPVIQTAVPREDGTIAFSWRAGVEEDSTPNDPLDYPDPGIFQPFASVGQLNDWEPLAEPGTATSFVVPDREKPVNLVVRTAPTAFGQGSTLTRVRGTEVTATIPKTAPTGGKLTVTGKSVNFVRLCDPGPCYHQPGPDANRLLRLESRTGSSAAWQPVATTRTGKDGKFTFRATFPGTRDYRVVAPPVPLTSDVLALTYFATAPVTTKATPAPGGGDSNGGDDDNGDNGNGNGGNGNGGNGGTGGGDGGGLPITGAPVAWITVAGGLLVALGAVFALGGRPRRRNPQSPTIE
jgi:hypothetical protein